MSNPFGRQSTPVCKIKEKLAFLTFLQFESQCDFHITRDAYQQMLLEKRLKNKIKQTTSEARAFQRVAGRHQ